MEKNKLSYKKKIVFLLPSNVAGGAERVMISLANYMAKGSDNVTIIFLNSESNFYSINNRINQVYLDCFEKSNSILEKIKTIYNCRKELYKYLKKNETEIVISFLFITNIIAISCCRKLNIPVIISERNDPLFYGTKQKKIMKMMYKHANGIVCQSEKVKKYMEEYYKNSNAIVIENPIAENQIGELLEKKSKKIISVGRLVKQKNQRLLIEAFSDIADKYPEYHLYIYGEGNLRSELEDLIYSRKMQERIFMPGIQKEVIKNNRDAQLFVLSSDFEGYPNVLVEAMANGIPVIASDINSGTVSQLISDGKNGYLYNVGDKEGLKVCLCKALSNLERTNSFAKSNLSVKEKLSIDNIAKLWMNYINTIMKL